MVATAITIFAGNYSSSAAQAVQDAADLGAATLPASIGVGIVKYRLYDIDRIFSRTLAYAIVTGLLVGVYLGLVLLASLVRPSSSPAVVAGSTLVVAALFHPLRRRVQRVVDRRFNRARYNADQIVAGFAARLQDAVDLGTVRDELDERRARGARACPPVGLDQGAAVLGPRRVIRRGGWGPGQSGSSWPASSGHGRRPCAPRRPGEDGHHASPTRQRHRSRALRRGSSISIVGPKRENGDRHTRRRRERASGLLT